MNELDKQEREFAINIGTVYKSHFEFGFDSYNTKQYEFEYVIYNNNLDCAIIRAHKTECFWKQFEYDPHLKWYFENGKIAGILEDYIVASLEHRFYEENE